MKCPIDGTQLVMSDRTGVEIDYCPQCRGVWLDRGELDKIIERSTDSAPQARAPAYDDRGFSDKPRKKKSTASMLGDLFDF